jgi:hypothetical protein
MPPAETEGKMAEREGFEPERGGRQVASDGAECETATPADTQLDSQSAGTLWHDVALRRLAVAWPRLPASIREAIMLIVAGHEQGP